METSNKIQAEIAQLEIKLTPINAQLDEKITEFSHELVSAVEKWMESEIKRKIEVNAKQVNTAGLEPLRAAKKDFNELIQKLPKLCEQVIGEKSMWPHHQEKTNKVVGHGQARKESYFFATFRKAINPIGSLLDTHDLLGEPDGSMATWKKMPGGNFEYQINPGFDNRNFVSVQAYDEILNKQHLLKKEIENKKQVLEKARSTELWNEA